MKKDKLFLSTIAPSAGRCARTYGLGVEIADFCTAQNLDSNRKDITAVVRNVTWGIKHIVFHAPFNELFPSAIDPKARELAWYRYRQSIKAAQEYNAQTLVIHSGYAPSFYYDCWFEEKSIEFWQQFMNKLPVGMIVCLENVLETRPEPLLHVLEGVNDPRLRICLDIGHVNVYSKVPVTRWLEQLAPWIAHFHIHNNFGERDTHESLNEGTIPMEELLRSAVELCPQAGYTLELREPEPDVRWLMEKQILE